jgi:phospholipase/carboxylesterase
MNYLPAIEIEPSNQATASIIWLHGLGASGDDFAALVPEFKKILGPIFNQIRFIFPHSGEIPVTINGGFVMPAWYDILDMPAKPNQDRKINQEQLLNSVGDVQKLIDREIERGIQSERILVLGFSQGGAVAYHAALTYHKPLAGIAGLSTYLPPLSAPLAFKPSSANANIDIQIYHGTLDGVVHPSLGLKAHNTLTELGYQPQYQDYPMEHQVCYEQVQDIAQWISACFN